MILSLAVTLLMEGVAQGKGSSLRFDRETYAPGDRAVAHARVEVWKGSGRPKDAPFAVYLVRGEHPLHFGDLPNDAINVGRLRIGGVVATHTYRVTVAFEVPSVPDGRYSVWVCTNRSGGTGCWLGFGDLVYGRIIVARET